MVLRNLANVSVLGNPFDPCVLQTENHPSIPVFLFSICFTILFFHVPSSSAILFAVVFGCQRFTFFIWAWSCCRLNLINQHFREVQSRTRGADESTGKGENK